MKTKVLFFLPSILLLPRSVWSETKGPSDPPKSGKPNANTLHLLRGKLEYPNKINEENAVSPDFKKNVEVPKKKLEELKGKAEKDKQNEAGTTAKGEEASQNVSQDGLQEQTPSDSKDGKAEEKKTEVKNVIFMKKEKAVNEEVGNKQTAIITEKKNLPIEESQEKNGIQAQESIEVEELPEVIVDKTDDSAEGETLSESEKEAKPSAESTPNEPNVNTTHIPADTHTYPSGEGPSAPKKIQFPSIDENANRRAARIKHMNRFLNGFLTSRSKNKNEIYFHPYYGPYFNHPAYYNYDPYYNYSQWYNPFLRQTKDYEVNKNLLGACFIKGEGAHPNVPCIFDIFKKVLDDERFRNGFRTFMYALYEFAKKNDVLSEEAKKKEFMRFFFDSAFQLLNRMLHH
ncbi:hypothetical protein C922_01844 [Plasmodium inui San Antonio 1]|uniref:Merozoite surface protein C-terminal domain-containing protein n=2 Tax=Plasmodium inui TaxID=52288 RepID=W7AF55_9APIC|nr:hypothetical protein C922_01844 [Plasmodium inui San Antonio 1]EUD67659.1 hypothetical protein C922_01844 [Plasmodium inui San Antonio 1]